MHQNTISWGYTLSSGVILPLQPLHLCMNGIAITIRGGLFILFIFTSGVILSSITSIASKHLSLSISSVTSTCFPPLLKLTVFAFPPLTLEIFFLLLVSSVLCGSNLFWASMNQGASLVLLQEEHLLHHSWIYLQTLQLHVFVEHGLLHLMTVLNGLSRHNKVSYIQTSKFAIPAGAYVKHHILQP